MPIIKILIIASFIKRERVMKTTLWFVGIVIITAIVGCVTIVNPIGRDFGKGCIKDIVIGQTTKSEIIKFLNVPLVR